MALTVSFDGTNVTTAESTTDWDNQTITAAELWSEVRIQGSNSIGYQSSNKDGWGAFNYTTGTFNFNVAHEGYHVFIWVNFTTPGNLESNTAAAPNGLYIIIGSSDTDYYRFKVAEKEYQDALVNGWARFVIDPTLTPTMTVGTPLLTAIDFFGVWVDTDAQSRSDNLFIDRIDVGKGLKIHGTSTDFWEDLYQEDMGTEGNRWGICDKYNGKYILRGGLLIGHSGMPAATTISDDSGADITFANPLYYNGTAWVSSITASDIYTITVAGRALFDTTCTFGSVVGSATPTDTRQGVAGGSIKTAGPGWLWDSTDAYAVINLYGVIFQGATQGIDVDDGDNTLIVSMQAINCGPLNLGSTNDGAEIIKSFIIDPTGDTNNYGMVFSQFFVDSSLEHNASDITFITSGTPTTQAMLNFPKASDYSMPLVGFKFFGDFTTSSTISHGTVTGLNADVVINSSGGTDIDEDEILTPNGGTITVNNNKSVTFTQMKDNTEVRVFNKSTGVEIDGIENATAGTTDNRTFTWSAAAGLEVTYVLHNFHTSDIDYETIRNTSYTVPTEDATIIISQRVDRNSV